MFSNNAWYKQKIQHKDSTDGSSYAYKELGEELASRQQQSKAQLNINMITHNVF